MDASSLQPLLVIDKSFAQAMKAHRLEALNTQYTFLVPSAFYFEVFDEPSKVRATLAGIREFRRVHIQTLIDREKESGKPCLEIETPPLTINPEVFHQGWILRTEEQAVMKKIESEVVSPLRAFWNDVVDVGVPGFETETLHAARYADDHSFVRICESLRNQETIISAAASVGFPHAAVLDDRWVSFRMFQTMLLQGLVLWRRYKDEKHQRSPKTIEHDFHDIEYLILGLHCGALATNETSTLLNKAAMGWRFKLLSPTGLLMSVSDF